MNKLPIIVNEGSFKQFIDCWSKFYDFGNEESYQYIHNRPFSEKDIRELFKWKNGMKLSIPKANSLESKIIPKVKKINELQSERELAFQTVKEYFNDTSAIWRIFLAHIIKPDIFPIFDQHVYRAMVYLQTNKIVELKNDDQTKLKIYEFEYLSFFNKLSPEITDYKKYDEAIWIFGKFLKQSRTTFK